MVKKKEIKRQFIHGSIGVIIALLLGEVEKLGTYYPLTSLDFLPNLARPLIPVLVGGAVIILLVKKWKIPGIDWIIRNFERDEAIKSFPGRGTFSFALGIFILALFFETEVVSASILILSIGDSSSHLIGGKFGKIKHPLSRSKKIEGNIAGAILGGLAASIFIAPKIAFIAGFVSMFVEGMELKEEKNQLLEDNLIVPIVAGTVIFLLK